MELRLMFRLYYENSLIHKAAGTCEYERAKIKRLLKLFDSLGLYDTSQIDKTAFNGLISSLKQKVSNKTINKLVLLTKLAYRFSEIEFDYLQGFPKLKEEKRRFNIIEQNELSKVMTFVVSSDSSIGNNLLYQTCIVLMIETGVRANELLNIRIKHINFADRSILLTTTKTKKERYVFFTKLSEKYIKLILAHGPKRELLLYNFLKSRSALHRDIKYMIDKLKKELNISKLHPHMFRHTFATLAYYNDIDVMVLKELLGHENLTTTQIYTHISKERLQAAYTRAFSHDKSNGH